MGEAGQVKKGKETDEGEKSKAVKESLKESIDFIAESGVELAIEATAEPTPTKPELNMSSGTDSSESTRSGEVQKSVDVAVTQKNKPDDAAQKTVSLDAAREIKSVDIALMNKPAENMLMNKSAEEKKDNVYADAIVASQQGVFGKSFVASKPVEKTSSISEAVAKKSVSADLKNGTESVKDILNDEKKATDVKDASGASKETSEVEVKGAQAVKDILNVEKKAADVKEAASKKVLLEEDLIEVDAELCNAETCTFEELNLSDYDSDLDADYSPSEESSSEDELEFNTDAEVSSVVDDLELLA